MTYFFIIVAVIFIIVFLFQSDKKEVIQKNLQIGGLKKRFPNFVEYLTKCEKEIELVKDNGEYLEYRYPRNVLNNKIGYFHFGLQNNFGTYLYTYAMSPRGNKIEGYIQEIHNGRDTSRPEDVSVLQYEFIFEELIYKMEKTKDFGLKFTDQK